MIRYNGKKPDSLKKTAEVLRPASARPPKQSTWYEQLYDAQRRAADFILSRPATALFCQARTGKTYISMAVLERARWRVALIVAPLTSLGIVWRPKLETLQKCHTLGSVQELMGALKRGAQDNYRLVVLTNPEALRRDARRLAKLPLDIVIWDESQNMKNRSSVNSRIAKRLRRVPRRIALSGTPMDTGQIDIWAQMRFVDHTVLGENWGGSTHTQWRGKKRKKPPALGFADRYCFRTGWQGKEWKFLETKNKQFLDAISQHVYRLDDKFMNLKPVEIIPVPIYMLGKQRKLYETMERDQLIRINGEIITANNAGARDVKLSQITGGAVLDRKEVVHPTGKAKQRKLLHLLRRDEWPVVIFVQYLHEIPIILELFDHEPYRVAIIRGDVKEADRTRLINDFQGGNFDVLICQIRTGGEAIDLTRSSRLIFYSMSYSYINWEQVLRRVQGVNQKKEVKAFILYCENTIDEDKLRLVVSKGEKSDHVLTHFNKGDQYV